MTLLEKIINTKRKEVSLLREKTSLRDLENSSLFPCMTLSLSDYIRDPARTGIIPEFKRKSPSGGIINPRVSVKEVTKGYSDAGASGLSILTDNNFFGGDCTDLINARKHNKIPILRKEFIIDEIQVIESKAAGADSILLIAAVLAKEQVLNLARLSHSVNMEIVLEIHSLHELDWLNEFVNIIGVNNRDLSTLKTDVRISEELAGRLPGDLVKISESGISAPQTVVELRRAGYDGFLIGEHFMTEPDPAAAFAEFVKFCKQ